MKLAYYVPATLLRHDGINRRSRATAETWRAQGHTVHEVLPTRPPERTDPLTLLRWHRQQDKQAAEAVAAWVSAGEVDHVHARLFVPGRAWVRLATTCEVSLEVHTLLRQAESLRDVYRLAAGRPARRLAERAAAAAFVTGEMAQRFGVPTLRRIALGTGVPLGDAVPAPDNPRLRVGMSVGSRGAWHGLDRLSVLAAEIPEVDWRLVVPDGLRGWSAAQLGKETSVQVCATSSRAEYDAAIACLDGAVGTLALDRRGLTEAAPLKVRDYAASGIPLLLPYRDTNLSAAVDPAVAEVDPTDQRATVSRVRSWLAELPGRRLTDDTRALVDLAVIERRRIDFLLDK